MAFGDKFKKIFKSNKKEDKSENEDEVKFHEKKNSKSGVKKFKYLDDLIHSGAKVIALDADISLGRREDSKYLKGIKLDIDGLIIDGCGHTIDANGKARIFYCTGKNITIKNVTLKNGCSQDYGGAIDTAENCSLTIEKSNFIKNKAEDSGAICNIGQLEIIESTFTENIAEYAGAITNGKKGSMTIKKSSFTKNNAENDGGAIDNAGLLKIIDSSFAENMSEGHGGAIRNIGKTAIENSSFEYNKTERGAAIYNFEFRSKRGSVTVSKSTFRGNESNLGGAIMNENGIMEVSDSIFSNNTAFNAGAIYNMGDLTIYDSTFSCNETEVYGILNNNGNLKIFNSKFLENRTDVISTSTVNNRDSLQIYDCCFTDNHAREIISNNGEESNLSIFNGEFLKNDVDSSVMINKGKFASITKTVFEKNLSHDETYNIINKTDLTLISPKIRDDGKTILNKGNLTLKGNFDTITDKIEGEWEDGSEIVPSVQKFDFGYFDELLHESEDFEDDYLKISFDGKSKIIKLKSDIVFESYESDFYEGGIELDVDNLIIDGDGRCIDGSNRSRIFIVTGKNITLENITFKNGHSHRSYDNPLNDHGGALRIYHDATASVKNCRFIENKSEKFGGAIYNCGELTISKSVLSGNFAVKGGAIYNFNSLMNIFGSKLSLNNANPVGGAIYNVNSQLNISETMLCNNSVRELGMLGAYGHGGAIFNEEGILNIEKSKLINNHAETEGGAISNDHGHLTIIKSEIANNTTKDGCAIMTEIDEIPSKSQHVLNTGEFTRSDIYINECIFKDNESIDLKTF